VLAAVLAVAAVPLAAVFAQWGCQQGFSILSPLKFH